MASLKDDILTLKVKLNEVAQHTVDEIKEALKELELKMMTPTLGRTVWYRGNQGYLAMRAAIVACTVNELVTESVSAGNIESLDSDMHVHLHVITPSVAGFFTEFNVPFGVPGDDGLIPPGTWCWPVIK